MFSFSRLVGADPMLGVEMASTGEVGCFGDDVHEALLHALIATGFRFPKKGVLLSLGPLQDKYWFADEARVIAEQLGLPIFATPGTAEALRSARHRQHQPGQGRPPTARAPSTPSRTAASISSSTCRASTTSWGGRTGTGSRRRAVDAGIPLLTDLQLARAVIEALRRKKLAGLHMLAYDEYAARKTVELR